jgi:cytochrome c
MLAEKIIKGGKGNWGDVMMTPHANVSQEDAEAMVKYIFTLKK